MNSLALELPTVRPAALASAPALQPGRPKFRLVQVATGWIRGKIHILFANGFYVTNNVAKAMLDALTAAADAGTAAVIEIYSGSVPADADASAAGLTLLASLTMSATSFGAAADLNPGARITANSITADSSADATGTASCFRIKTQTGGTVICQGTVGTASADLILNTVSITAGSTVSITSGTITLPEGP